jgi:murein L,D-transpeptidase YcbB/YkuD
VLSELWGETGFERAKSVVILLLAAIAAVGLQQLASTRQQLSSQPTAEAQALDVARAFAAALTTYDYAHLDVQDNRLQGLVAPGVLDSIRTSQPDLVVAKASSNGSAGQAYLQSFNGQTAVAVVQTEQTISTRASVQAVRASGLFSCRLQLGSDGWRVTSYQWLTPVTATTP